MIEGPNVVVPLVVDGDFFFFFFSIWTADG